MTLIAKLVQVVTYKKCKPLAEQIGQNVSPIYDRLAQFKKGSEIKVIHSTVAADLREERERINKKMGELSHSIAHTYFANFARIIREE